MLIQQRGMAASKCHSNHLFPIIPPPPNGQVDNSFQNSRVNANSSFGSTENSTENILRYTKVLTLEATGQIFNWREEMNEFQRKH